MEFPLQKYGPILQMFKINVVRPVIESPCPVFFIMAQEFLSEKMFDFTVLFDSSLLCVNVQY